MSEIDGTLRLTDQKAPPPLTFKLVVVGGPDVGKEVPLRRAVTVGTDPTCELVLRDPAVSRRHFRASAEAGRVVIEDLESRNGTFVDGTRLRQGDVALGAVLHVGTSAIVVQASWYQREVEPLAAGRFGDLVGGSVSMREIFAMMERVAMTDCTVLVEGESGTGKELAARSIHKASVRARQPYVVVDCSALPGDLAESELFGHLKGAFSGAVGDRQGMFQRADGGTIFLDEIGELPVELQPKLLRVLEASEVRSVGSDTAKKIDVRVVAATNRDLQAEARRGGFRTDLLYRLEVVKIRMPPLRHRPEDIPDLVRNLLAGELPEGDEVEGENLARLMAYSWPGNVREMRNVLKRAVALARKPARFRDLVFNLGPAPAGPIPIGMDFPGVSSRMPYKEAKAQLLASFERAYVEALLSRHRGNISQAANEANLSRKHLYELIRRTTGEDIPDPEEPLPSG